MKLILVLLIVLTLAFLALPATGQLNCSGGIWGCATGFTAANQMLLSGSALGATPSWSTSTIPSSAGATIGKWLRSDGTNYVLSTPVMPNTATANAIIVGDGTNWTGVTTGNQGQIGALSVNGTLAAGYTFSVAAGTSNIGGRLYSPGISGETGTKAALCQDTATGEVEVNVGVSTCLVSSLDLKDWIADLSCREAKRIVRGMRPAIFKDKDGADGPRFGFAAQWTEKVEPRLVDYYKGKPRGVDYERYTAVLTKILQCGMN